MVCFKRHIIDGVGFCFGILKRKKEKKLFETLHLQLDVNEILGQIFDNPSFVLFYDPSLQAEALEKTIELF